MPNLSSPPFDAAKRLSTAIRKIKIRQLKANAAASLKFFLLFMEPKIGKKYVFNHRVNKRSPFATNVTCIFLPSSSLAVRIKNEEI